MIHKFINYSKATDRTPKHQSFRSEVEQRHTPIQLHDPTSKDIGLAASIAQELVNVSGALVTIYPRTENESYDDVWEEDRHPSYGAGRTLKGYFVPQPIESQLTPWGVDAPNQTTIVFSRQEIFELFGDRMVREGDIIKIPYNSAVKKFGTYRVLNAFESGNFKYNWMYHNCLIENITDDETININHQ